MYASPKERSADLTYYHGGTIASPADTEKSLDLPKSVYLAKPNPVEKKFSIRVDLHSKYIEIPLSMDQLKEWFAKIEEEDAVELEQEKADIEYDIEYDIGQEKELNDSENTGEKCTLTPSTYDHAGDCVPSKEKCEFCYKYWCGKCGNGVSNYLVKCCY